MDEGIPGIRTYYHILEVSGAFSLFATAWVVNTQLNHWSKWVVRTRVIT